MLELMKQQERPEKVRLYALMILANLSLKEMLRPQIVSANGIDMFL